MMEKEPVIISDKKQMRSWSRNMRSQGKVIALVPTMGYLHQGHLSLIQEAQNHAHIIVVSIYVNPGQFSPSEDLATYPSDFQGDLHKVREAGAHAIFHPQNLYDYDVEIMKLGPLVERSDLCGREGGISSESCGNVGVFNEKEGKMETFVERKQGRLESSSLDGGEERKVVSCIEGEGGKPGHETWIRVERLERGLCGKSRPVFFRGVATVVAKLFNIVEPDVVIFGKKDYQQWRIIRRMVRDLDFGINVIGSEIVRDPDGLALSSRNVHLSHDERQKALSIYQSLSKAKSGAQNGQVSCRELQESVMQAIVDSGGRVDYAEIVDQETLDKVEEIRNPVVFCVAAWFGKVRLIDNMEITL